MVKSCANDDMDNLGTVGRGRELWRTLLTLQIESVHGLAPNPPLPRIEVQTLHAFVELAGLPPV